MTVHFFAFNSMKNNKRQILHHKTEATKGKKRRNYFLIVTRQKHTVKIKSEKTLFRWLSRHIFRFFVD